MTGGTADPGTDPDPDPDPAAAILLPTLVLMLVLCRGLSGEEGEAGVVIDVGLNELPPTAPSRPGDPPVVDPAVAETRDELLSPAPVLADGLTLGLPEP